MTQSLQYWKLTVNVMLFQNKLKFFFLSVNVYYGLLWLIKSVKIIYCVTSLKDRLQRTCVTVRPCTNPTERSVSVVLGILKRGS